MVTKHKQKIPHSRVLKARESPPPYESGANVAAGISQEIPAGEFKARCLVIPVDRILIATARLTGAALVTCDERLLAYARQGHLQVVDATR